MNLQPPGQGLDQHAGQRGERRGGGHEGDAVRRVGGADDGGQQGECG